jgi:hypothetical protein
MNTKQRFPRFLFVLLTAALSALMAASGCDDDEPLVGANSALVGGPCAGDLDCVERCVEGGEFPYGTCTLSCSSDYNCPAYTYCIDKKGGVCLPACYANYDCRLEYRCRKTKREGAGGEVYVCIN